MMTTRQPLDKALRRTLEATVIKARDIAELAATQALSRLGVGDAKPADYAKVEYLYMKAAKELGLKVAEVELIKDRDYSHLMIKRFDRENGSKIHMHSLCGLTHTNFNIPGIFSYEDYLKTVDFITKDKTALTYAFLHMVFNIITCNQDDHTKNFSFLMDQNGEWKTSPLYDITYNKRNDYTSKHQMSVNGKRDAFILDDILSVNKKFKIDSDKNIIELVNYYYEFFMDFILVEGKALNISKEKLTRIRENCRKL